MAKGFMIIDGQRVAFDGEKNVLSVVRKAGIEMPTFCYHSDLSTYGACRMCMVEDEKGGIEAACQMLPRDGLRIRTNTSSQSSTYPMTPNGISTSSLVRFASARP